nr:polyketide synthase dehydratase domain-containing protein [Micromonospora sp. DSM 115978]
MELADGNGHVLSGEISAAAGGWMTEHVVEGTVLLPGTALVGWALHAADEVGCTGLNELVLTMPLILPESGVLPIQMVVGPLGDDGLREVRIYSRQHDEWRCHASGSLTTELQAGTGSIGGLWPPVGAEPVDVGGFYGEAEAAGYGYGPAFRGLRAVWRHGEDLLAEVELPKTEAAATGGDIHPALLDAALHPLLLGKLHSGQKWLPFSWSGVTLHAVGAKALRVRLSGLGDQPRLLVADDEGVPVLSADAVGLRPVGSGFVGSGVRGLFAVELVPVPVPVPVPVAVSVSGLGSGGGVGDGFVVVEVGSVGEVLGCVGEW